MAESISGRQQKDFQRFSQTLKLVFHSVLRFWREWRTIEIRVQQARFLRACKIIKNKTQSVTSLNQVRTNSLFVDHQFKLSVVFDQSLWRDKLSGREPPCEVVLVNLPGLTQRLWRDSFVKLYCRHRYMIKKKETEKNRKQETSSKTKHRQPKDTNHESWSRHPAGDEGFWSCCSVFYRTGVVLAGWRVTAFL